VVLLVALSPNQVENIPPIFPPYHHLCGPVGSSLTKSTRKYTTNISILSPFITTPLLKRCPSRPPPEKKKYQFLIFGEFVLEENVLQGFRN
jgi:hypothetical protein